VVPESKAKSCSGETSAGAFALSERSPIALDWVGDDALGDVGEPGVPLHATVAARTAAREALVNTLGRTMNIILLLVENERRLSPDVATS
jgi:hypothetical protein